MTDTEYTPTVLADMQAAIQAALPLWGLSPRTEPTLLNISENATWRLSDPEAPAPLILRIHRVGYHTEQEIRSELAWIEALRTSGHVSTAAIHPTTTGDPVATLPSPTGLPTRHAVAFQFLRGQEPAADAALVPWFHTLGAITARLHQHAATWPRPPGFTRKLWDWDAMLGERRLWGPWQSGLGLTPEGAAIIARASEKIRHHLSTYGQTPDRFGLVHADMRLANLLVDGPQMHVIDFDDCGLSWHLYDFAAAITLHEHTPIIPALQSSWLEGYAKVAPLPPNHQAMLPTLIMARRILVMAWMASHSETPMAREGGPTYTAQTIELAETFLARK
ncbi:MAG: phosphotransferase [Alphaproteobacteria bacterium]|nr:phosphotransferase [Alphaproteobacteria bacterium]